VLAIVQTESVEIRSAEAGSSAEFTETACHARFHVPALLESSRGGISSMFETNRLIIRDVMNQEVVIVFGGSSGIGEACAQAMKRAGGRVVITGRDTAKLGEAARRLDGVETAVVDARDRSAVMSFFAVIGAVDHVIVCVSGGKGAGVFKDLDLDQLRAAFEEKTLAQLTVAQAAAGHVRPGGSITLVTAASARSVVRGTSGLAAVNGAIEAMVPILALELAPVRVNAISPGVIDTAYWSGKAMKDSLFRTAEATLPVARVGSAEEVAELIALVARSGFITGSVYEIDGGSHLVTQ
jgi:NAD(P)-dependent dehydrogenase (short-subunit alcohol dehydrogenase family)